MYFLMFEIAALPKTTNAMQSMHWTKKAAYVKNWHAAVWCAVGVKKPPAPLKRAKVVLTRFSSMEPDFDGLVSSFKPVLDGLKLCGVIVDDKTSVIGQPEYRWDKSRQKAGKIQVIIQELSE